MKLYSNIYILKEDTGRGVDEKKDMKFIKRLLMTLGPPNY